MDRFARTIALTAALAMSAASTAQAAIGDGVLGARAPLVDIAQVEKAQFVFDNQNYCWYPYGWQGPGWYWCGYQWTNNYGWGGPFGWHGWGPRGWRGPGRGAWSGAYPGGHWHGGFHGGGHWHH